jgi:hypothetical protein
MFMNGKLLIAQGPFVKNKLGGAQAGDAVAKCDKIRKQHFCWIAEKKLLNKISMRA